MSDTTKSRDQAGAQDQMSATDQVVRAESSALACDATVIVVSFNTRQMTIDCIRSVFAQSDGLSFELIVVDNASNDGSAAAIREEFPSCRLLELGENIGFARANNLAAKEARGRYILLLNPDTVVLDQALTRLFEFARSRPDGVIWGGRTVFADGSLNPKSCWGDTTLWSLGLSACGLTSLFPNSTFFNPEAYGGWPRDTCREVDIVAGCLLLISREEWERLGGFDEHFFMYCEEADLCHRARQAGGRCLFTPDASIVHYGGASERTKSEKGVKLYAARVTFVDKHWAPVSAFIGKKLLLLTVLSRAVACYVLKVCRRSATNDARFSQWAGMWNERATWLTGFK